MLPSAMTTRFGIRYARTGCGLAVPVRPAMAGQPTSHGFHRSARDLPRLITAQTFAEILSVSKRTLQRMIQRGDVPRPNYLGTNPRWQADEVAQWIEDGCPPAAH